MEEPVDNSLAERLARLERRLAALESTASAAPSPVITGDAVLESLREQVSQPGAVLSAGTVTLPTTGLVEWQNAHSTADLLEADWSTRASALAALAHPIRLKLLQQILAGRTSVTALGEVEGLGTSGQIYHHLRQLTAEGWLHTPTRATYTIPTPRLPTLLTLLAALTP